MNTDSNIPTDRRMFADRLLTLGVCEERHCLFHCPELDGHRGDYDYLETTRRRLQKAVKDGCYLEGARLGGIHLEDLMLRNAHLEGANLSAAHLDGACLEHVHLSADTDCRWTRWGLCGEERAGNWMRAGTVYRTIGRHYNEAGDYGRCDEFYFREMRMYHRNVWGILDYAYYLGVRSVVIDWTEGHWSALKQGWKEWWRFLGEIYEELTESPAKGRIWKFFQKPKAVISIIAFPVWHALWRWCKWPFSRFIWGLHRFVWGYGVRPARTFGWMMAVIFLSTLGFFWWLPVTFPDRSNVLPCENPGGLAGLRLAVTVSLDAFSSVGYGGYRPATDWGQLLAGIEGMAGILLAAAFLVALATKYVRRG